MMNNSFLAVAAVLLLSTGPGAGAADLKKEPLMIGESVTLHSAVLDEDRTVRVVFPQDYHQKTKRYPVLYVLDAEWHLLSAAGAAKYLSETSYLTDSAIPEMIVVGIVNVNRDRDFTPTDGKKMASLWTENVGKAELMARFLKDELKPVINSNYRTSGYDIITGWSYGGLFTLFTLFHHPGLFDGYIAVSPSLWWDQEYLVQEIKENWDPKILQDKRLIMTIGEKEKQNVIYKGIKELADFLEEHAPNGTFTFHEVPSANHNSSPPKAHLFSLEAVFSDLDVPQDVLQAGFDKIVSYYEGKSSKYKTRIRVPWYLYDAYGRHYLKEKEFQAALDLYRIRAEEYPESSGALAAIGDIYREKEDFLKAIDYYERAIALEKSRDKPDVRVLEHNEQEIKKLKKSLPLPHESFPQGSAQGTGASCHR